MKLIEFLASLHEKAGRLLVTLLGMVDVTLLAFRAPEHAVTEAIFAATTILGVYIGGASAVRFRQEMTKKK